MIETDRFRETFCADVGVDLAQVMALSQRPLAAAAIGEPLSAEGWSSRPTWYQVAARDNAISPDAQRFMAKRMNADHRRSRRQSRRLHPPARRCCVVHRSCTRISPLTRHPEEQVVTIDTDRAARIAAAPGGGRDRYPGRGRGVLHPPPRTLRANMLRRVATPRRASQSPPSFSSTAPSPTPADGPSSAPRCRPQGYPVIAFANPLRGVSLRQRLPAKLPRHDPGTDRPGRPLLRRRRDHQCRDRRPRCQVPRVHRRIRARRRRDRAGRPTSWAADTPSSGTT